MEPCRVELAPAVARALEKLPFVMLVALRGVIRALGDDPHPPGARKLAGARDFWRVRLRIDGTPWRVVHQVRRRDGLVVVTRVARRDETTYRHG